VSAPIAALQRLARVRERLRDVAAAAATQTESVVAAARAAQSAADRAAEALLDRTPLGARSVHVLVEHADELVAAKAAAAEALRLVAARQVVSRRAAAELGQRERSLRSIERMLQAARAERAARGHKAEQRLADDLASVRRR
jgi:hypothetical protein